MVPDRSSLAALDRALAARQSRREGHELRFLCPAHDDRNPSARWHCDKHTWYCDVCKAGGGWRDLASRLGVEPQDATHSEIEAIYDYRDAEGRLRFQILRKCGKTFVCRQPLPGGSWAWNLAGVERVLYRLPETLDAVRAGATVFVVEGEKDVDRLVVLGLTATTNPGGAGKWSRSFSDSLRGARVVILPDHDAVGRRHAEMVAAGLVNVAAEVRLLTLPGLPDKGDVSDWIAGHMAAGRVPDELRCELEDLAAAAPAAEAVAKAFSGRPSRVRCLSEIAPQEVAFLWHPYIPLAKITILEGDPGQGKSWIGAAIAAAGSRGQGLPASPPFAPFQTILFTGEDGVADTLRPRLDAMGADCQRILVHDQALDLAREDDLAELEHALAEHRPRLVVLDPIVAYLGAKTDAYRANEVRSILAPLARLADTYRCAILAVRHLNKAKGTRSIYAGQGSIDFTAAARSVLLAGCASDDTAGRALVHIKSNLTRLGVALAYAIDDRGFRWTGESPLRASDLLGAEATGDEVSMLQEACAFLRGMLAGGPVSTQKIWETAREEGLSQVTVRRAKQREGIIALRQGYGPGGAWQWAYETPPEKS